MWNDTRTNKKDIIAKYGKKSFTLAFSQEEITHDQIDSIGTEYCCMKNQDTVVYSWLGTQRALVTPENYNQFSNLLYDFLGFSNQRVSLLIPIKTPYINLQ